jgi:hypothetical protein
VDEIAGALARKKERLSMELGDGGAPPAGPDPFGPNNPFARQGRSCR